MDAKRAGGGISAARLSPCSCYELCVAISIKIEYKLKIQFLGHSSHISKAACG